MEQGARSWLSIADPRVKLSWFVTVTVVTMLPLGNFALALAVVPIVAFLGGVYKLSASLTLLFVPAFLALLTVSSLLFDSEASRIAIAILVVKWAAMIYGSLFFVAATPIQETHFLIRWTRIPTSLGISLFFAIRTIPSSLEQLHGLTRAMKARGLWPISWSVTGLASVFGLLPDLSLSLLISALRRTDQIWTALELRGGWSRIPQCPRNKRSSGASLLLSAHLLTLVALPILHVVRP